MRNTKLFFNFSLAAMLVITAAGIAVAQHQSTPRTATGKALAEEDVKQLLLLMDTDKNGKISRQEYMHFMQVEFDRLDKDKNGELDPKELTESRLRPSTFSTVGK